MKQPMAVQFRCVKSELPLHCNDDADRNPWRWQIFLGDGRSKVPLPSIDFLSCGVGCEFHHHHDCNCAAGGRRKISCPSAGLHWLTSYYRGASTMQPDQLLVPCPKCHAWPMAVHAGKRKWASDAPMVRFTCAKCGHQEEERLGGPYTKRESSRQHEIAGGGF